jgi:hypothetical protein
MRRRRMDAPKTEEQKFLCVYPASFKIPLEKTALWVYTTLFTIKGEYHAPEFY